MASKANFFAFFLLLITACVARQQHQQQQQNQCQIQNIEALEPNDIVQAEAGVTEFWDADNQLFQCAGVDFIRHRIQPGGLLLPSYVNTPILSFVEQGRGIQGVILPGCPETYEYLPEQQQFSGQPDRRGQPQDRRGQPEDRRGQPQDRRGQPQDRRGQRFQSEQDSHQKVENINEGDVVAIPTGAAHWVHNDGDRELVVVVFFDTQNNQNQLDENHRRFFLAGNPQGQSQQRQPRRQTHKEGGRRQQDRQSRREQPYQNAGNVFSSMDVEFIAEAFNVDRQTAEKLQGQEDQRGHIVNVGQELQLVRPSKSRQQQHQQSSRRSHEGSNGLEETICSQKLKENIENPSHADFVNPQAGVIANLNSFKFPILQQLQLSIEKGHLHPNAIRSPYWTFNAHSLLYLTEGSLQVQIVNSEGRSVFNDELREGQVVVIPQNFAVIKRAGEQGARWVSFKTNDNAMISNLAGRVSVIRSMPVGVVANSYQLSREDAQRLKFSQQQQVLFTPTSSRGGQRASA